MRSFRWLVVLLLAVALASCGARKEKSDTSSRMARNAPETPAAPASLAALDEGLAKNAGSVSQGREAEAKPELPPTPQPTPQPDPKEPASELLNKQLAPDDGTWNSPIESFGKEPKSAWSRATIASAVGGKPLKGEVTTLVGEVVDLGIYIQTGGHGAAYRVHMLESTEHDGPIGLVTAEGKCYLLLAEEYMPRVMGYTELRPLLCDRLGDIIKVSGTAIETGGMAALYVQGFVSETWLEQPGNP